MGATGGLGRRCAEIMAAAGDRVGVAGRNEEALKQLKALYPDNIEYAVIDVNDADAGSKIDALAERLGGMDIYFHVSGIGYENSALEPEKELATLETDTVGFARCVGHAFRYFRDKCAGHGQIAAITSVAGTNGIGRAPAYSAAKAADSTYLCALQQLASKQKGHITVTDIRPGFVDTPLLAKVRYPMTMTPDYAARRIVRAIRRRRRVAVIDWRWNILVALWRLIPNALWTRLKI